jgi:hypothetical protein
MFIDTTANDCKYGDECDKRLCRSYQLGRVIGAKRYARSTSVKVGCICTWTGKRIRVKITGHQPDKTVDIDKLFTDIYEGFSKALRKGTYINISKRTDT